VKEPTFSIASAPRRHSPGHNPLSATFNRYKAHGPAIATLDEALYLLDRRQREKAARARRDEGVVRHVAQGALFGLSRAHAKARSGKVKMPSFSIQKSDA
jgi:hypothetical protein